METTREGLVLLLLREGSRTHAVKLYQEEAGVGLFEAQQAVAMLACKHGIAMKGHGIMALTLITLAFVLGMLLAF